MSTSSSTSFLQTSMAELGPLDLSKKIIENTQQAHQNQNQNQNLNHNQQNNYLLFNFKNQLEQHFLKHQLNSNNNNNNNQQSFVMNVEQQQQLQYPHLQLNSKKRKRKCKIAENHSLNKKIDCNSMHKIQPDINNNSNNEDNYECSNSLPAADSVNSQILKAHLCLDCGRSFARSDMLTRHSRLHSGLKPYKCKRCNQIFSRSDHLSTHERTHTGEKPYQCEQCSYSACRRDMITRHMRTHENAINRLQTNHNKLTRIKKNSMSKINDNNNNNNNNNNSKSRRKNCKSKSPTTSYQETGSLSEPDQSTSETMDLNLMQSPLSTPSESTMTSNTVDDFNCDDNDNDNCNDSNDLIISDTTPIPTTTITTERLSKSSMMSACHPLDLSAKYNGSAQREAKTRVVINYQISSTS